MSSLLANLVHFHGPLAYLLVGLLAFGESAAFLGMVLPGETALLFGGVLAAHGSVSLPAMVAVGVLAAIAGDSVGYETGRRFGPGLKASRTGRRIGAARWARAEAMLQRAGGKAVFAARFVAVIRALMPTLAGMGRLPYRRFVAWNAAGGLVWGAGFVLLGYAAAGSISVIDRYLRLGWVPLVVGIALFLLVRRLRHRRADGKPTPRPSKPRPTTSRRNHLSPRLPALAVTAGLAVSLAACGSSSSAPAAPGPASPSAAETNPSGDIPDNIAYVPYKPPGGRYSVAVPEGWSRSGSGGVVVFTDKLNSVRVEVRPLVAAPTQASVRDRELAGKGATATLSTVTLPAGPAVKATYQTDSAPDPVTGKTRRDTVERFSLWKSGTEAVLTLAGPVGADNVDPYKKITDSFAWQ